MSASVERSLAGFIQERLMSGRGEAIAEDFDLLGSGVLDSLGAFTLVFFIEEEFGIEVPPQDITIDHFQTVAAIADYLRARGLATNGDDPSGETVSETARDVEGLLFGPPERSLFGIHHKPTGTPVRDEAVLLCGPVGWESTHAHWAMRRLAIGAAARGFHVLRFDYSGTGDSSGEGSDATVERWIDDIGLAAAEARSRSGVERLSVVGLRLGAALAAAARDRGLSVDRLVLWDPVVRGSDYVGALERMQSQVVARPGPPVVDLGGATDPLMGEVLGYAMPASLREGLSRLDLNVLSSPTCATHLVASGDRTSDRELVSAWGEGVTYEVRGDAGGWEQVTSRDSIVLATRIPSHIVAWLGGA